MALIPVVDKNDTIIAYKDRSQLNPAVDIIRSASVWITNNKRDVLLAQRKRDKRIDPGKWGEAVGGTVEENNDSYEATASREAFEELGIQGKVLTKGPKQFIASSSISFLCSGII